MYGSGIGTLNVYGVAQNSLNNLGTPLWSRSHDQGNQWRQAAVTISVISNYQIVFEGIVGNNYMGDIGLDDLSLASGACTDTSNSFLSSF
jgi:hypothetical protein